MKYFFKKEWKWLVVVLTIFMITIGLLLIKTNYEVITPAVISPVGDYITVGDEKNNKTDINTTSVYGFSKANLLNFLVARLNPFVDENRLYSYIDTSDKYETEQGTLHRDFSIRNAIVSAYRQAGYDINLKFKGYTVTSIYYFGMQMNFKLGDKILKVDDIELTEELDLTSAIRRIREKDSDKVIFNCLIERDLKEQEVLLELYVLEDTKYCPIVTEIDYSYKIPEEAPICDYEYGNALGPSGGLMQALYIYENLTGCELSNGLKIAGTGTIDIYGNASLIGGMKQKIYTANANGVDIFFVPFDKNRETKDERFKNWYEAEDAYDKLIFTNMEIVPVSSLYDIIEYLEGRK